MPPDATRRAPGRVPPGPVGRPRLVAAIRGEIRRHGPLTFATFMDRALYHPRHGYYSVLRAPPGMRGDFYTSPETHPAFGALLARQLADVWARLNRPATFTVEEWGGGSGALAADVLAAAPAYDAAFAASLAYRIVELSPALRRQQQRRLRPWASRVDWAAGEPLPPLEGCVVANELLDAFPVHRVSRRDAALQEVYVDWDQDAFREREGPSATPALAAYFARLGLLPPDGTTVEVNLAALAWLRGVAARLTRGALLLIDYGHPAEVLYSERYPHGTLRSHYRHGVGSDPYVRVGWQDLTSDVDLTSVLLEGRELGLTPLGIGRQANFLRRLGWASYARAVEQAGGRRLEQQASRHGLEALVNPRGLGACWVLGFGRGLSAPLRGLEEGGEPEVVLAVPGALRPRLGWGR